MPILTNILRILSGSVTDEEVTTFMSFPSQTVLAAMWIGMSVVARQHVTKLIAGWVDPAADVFAIRTSSCMYKMTTMVSCLGESLHNRIGKMKEAVDKLCTEVPICDDECGQSEADSDFEYTQALFDQTSRLQDQPLRSVQIKEELAEMTREMEAKHREFSEKAERRNLNRRFTDPPTTSSPSPNRVQGCTTAAPLAVNNDALHYDISLDDDIMPLSPIFTEDSWPSDTEDILSMTVFD